MKLLFAAHTAFTLTTFTEATPQSCIEKLKKETKELEAELASPTTSANRVEEYVDCVMCLFDSAARLGITASEFEDAFIAKLKKNKSRQWVKNPDNTYSHVKQA